MVSNHKERMARARLSLDGLSIGDAFGERFFRLSPAARITPAPPWCYTDDTVMAMSVTEVLDRHRGIDPEALAAAFAKRYAANPARGYGGMAHHILQGIANGGIVA